MIVLKVIPLLLSSLLLAAHFLRADLTPLVLLALALPLFLLFKKQWATRLVQLCLILGAMEWLRTLSLFVAERRALEQPWTRLVLIMGAVALFTGLSALPLHSLGSDKTAAAKT